MRASEARHRFLFRLCDALRPIRDPIELQRTACTLLAQHLDADRAYCGEGPDDEGLVVVPPDYFRPGLKSVAGRNRVTDSGEPLSALCAGRTFAVADTQASWAADYPALESRASITVPRAEDGKLAWALTVASVAPRQWTEDEVALVREVGVRTWDSIRLAFAEAALRRSEEKFRTLFETMDEGFCILQVLFDEAGRAVDFVFLETNPAYEKNAGVTGVVGKSIREVVSGPVDSWIELYGRIARTGVPERFTIHAEPMGGRWFDTYAFRMGAPEGSRVAVLFRDVSERKNAEEALYRLKQELEQQVADRTAQLELRTRQLQSLALQLTGAVESERKRIARLLHEDVQQLLASARFRLGSLNLAEPNRQAQQEILHEVDALLGQSIDKSRRLSQELGTAMLHDVGLPAALEWLGRRMRAQHGLEVEVTAHAWHRLRSEPLRVFLYRAVAELLLNVVKHAGVKQARVRLDRYTDRVEVSVQDAGAGFDPALAQSPAGHGIGLLHLREQLAFFQGRLDVESASGRGSRITLVVPHRDLEKVESFGPAPQSPESADSCERSADDWE